MAWSAANGWSLPHSIFSTGQLALLAANPAFVLGQNGPRRFPIPTPIPLEVASLGSAHAYYVAISELVRDFGSVDGLAETINASAARIPLASRMRPAAKTVYPASDVVSYTVSGTDSAYTGQRHFHFSDSGIQKRWRYSGVWFDYANNPVNQISGATEPGDFNNSTSYEVEFYATGTDVTLWMRSAAQSDFKVLVDDMPLTTGWDLTSAGVFDHNYARIQFTTDRVRKIRLLASGFLSFTGVLVPAGGAIWAAPPRFRVAITGDSYVQGGHWLGPIGHLMGGALCNQLAIQTGWEVLNLGQGGTGYVNDSAGEIGKSAYGSAARLAALAALPPIDLFIAFGSGNDSGYSTGSVITAANAFWNAVHTARPDTPIVVVGVESGSPTGFDPSLMSALNTALIAAAQANPNVAGAIDMRTDPWWTGAGNEGSPEGDGNADFFMSADEVHPSRAGYENLALRLADKLAAIRV
ncbi:SGNH/GDSL hydrolase family protein [Mycolicibacterium sp. J2]|uniref:SGNH/GDSL hydrolase family protein n=1 Tax=Mycolicibacterium sp. J2 TaxID=2993511 RepID=UPI00224A67ED|nr:SGNH/GDSL hydrolase family protein [Mycolicibacterium sp. J2]MCX2714233.1 SGNH/GDSL hydrolase family protein [Mycolicibacterium sp. J2]